MKNRKQGILVCIMTFAFWGVMYPQFSLVEECYEYVSEQEGAGEECKEFDAAANNTAVSSEKNKATKKNPQEDFFLILNADRGEIVIKSKLWEVWKSANIKKEQNGADTRYGRK